MKSVNLALINLRILCVTQGRQCLGLICFCGINSCIAFKRVVFKTVHCVFTEVCSVVLCMQLRRVESFDLIPSQLAFRKMNMLRWGVFCRLGRALISMYTITPSTLELLPGISVYTGAKCRAKLRYYKLARSILVLQFEVGQALHLARVNLARHFT